MSRKHYVAIAKQINEVREGFDLSTPATAAIEQVAQRIADVMANDNPNFDTSRFLKACGVRS